MPIRNAEPLLFQASGVADAVDQVFDGSCQNLQNLIFDRNNRGAVVPRPGVTQVTSFPGFTTPGVVSVAISVGTRIYGLIATGRNAGFDEPFVYETATGAFITVSGVTSANVPTTQSTAGAWTPPTMDVVGTKLVVTHPGFSGANFIGWFDLSNPAAPAWSAGNTATTALPSVPLWVCQFFGRAYYGCGNQVWFSDALNATNIGTTAAGLVLTLGDSSSSTAGCGLPLNSSSGGILQSLIVFKGNSIFQITGDGSSIAMNALTKNTGCTSPRTVTVTPLGIFFISTDGPRKVDLRGEVTYLQNESRGSDLVAPFGLATNPSRMCAAYNNGVYRVAFDASMTVWNQTYTSVDYWFDYLAMRWNGSHTFPYHLAVGIGKTFYLASNTYPGILFQSDVVVSSGTVFTDNGSAYDCLEVTSAMNGGAMAMSAIVESTIELCSSSTNAVYYISAYDDQNNPLAVATIPIYTAAPKWGTDRFGQFQWRNSQVSNKNYSIPWVNPITTKKLILNVRVTAAQFVSIKTASFRVQKLGYTNNP